jgi:GNAT superfamily N-acetyltransferase
MIRPVLYVDLPGIIYAIDRRARSKQHELANFVCWLEPEENRILLPPILRNIFPLNPASLTWICEDHWRILGFGQVQERSSGKTWDLSYLASMVNSNISSEEVLAALLDYILEIAATHGILRIFAKVDDEIPEMELFQKAGFQRYARQLTYVFDPTAALPGSDASDWEPGKPQDGSDCGTEASDQFSGSIRRDPPSLRRWNRHHVWGLHQLYRAVTPQRVQMAEMLEKSEEFAKLYVGSLHPLPSFLSRGDENYVYDAGVRLGAWLRICRGHGPAPHQLSLIVHPEHAELAEPIIRFGMRRLLEGSTRPIYCQVREYDSFVITALRSSSFEHVSTRALLVRHIAMLAMNPRTVPALEQRVAYGVKGLGTVNSRQSMR